MTFSRRLIDLARANLNAVLDAVGGEEDEEELGRDEGAPGRDEDPRAARDAEPPREAPRRGRSRRRSKEMDDLEERLREELRRYDSAKTTEDRTRDEYERFKERMRGRSSRRGTGRSSSSSGRTRSRSSRSASSDLAQHYANLEVPVGTPWPEVKRSYRRLAVKFHPDRHGGNPERMRISNELQLKLNRSYQALKSALNQ